MEVLKVKPGDTLKNIAVRFKVTVGELVKANPVLKDPDRIYPGQLINIPIEGRHAPSGSATGVPNAPDAGSNPVQDPKYFENLVAAVGLPIWGGPFYLYRKVVNGRGIEALVLNRNQASLDTDPLQPNFFELRSIYASKTEAEAAASSYHMPGSYSYYKTADGIVYPTIISETTAPRLCKAMRQAVAEERVAARAAADLSVNLLLWYVGARMPPVTGGAAKASVASGAADAALAGFNSVERGIIVEVRGVVKASEFGKIRQAFAAGKDAVVQISGRTIQYEPSLKASGMTMFGENGFLIGPEAFASESELIKTLLHETYRLNTSISTVAGVSAAMAAAETQAAFTFAEKAYAAVLAGL